MIFEGISRVFSLKNEDQYNTIGAFWDEMTELYGLENLQGLGYNWRGAQMSYAIGPKEGLIKGANVSISLPDDGWISAEGQTDHLKALYDEIYKDGALLFEIETFFEDGRCQIWYYREIKK